MDVHEQNSLEVNGGRHLSITWANTTRYPKWRPALKDITESELRKGRFMGLG